MTALSFRQVLDRLNLSSDDDLLSLMARVPQWTDTGAIIDIYSPGMYGHEYRRDGVPLSLDGDSDCYISENVGPLRLRMWVTREDYRSACHISAPVSPFAYRRVLWGDEETFDYGTEPDSPDTPPHRIRLFAGGAFRVWGVELMDDLVTFRLAPWRWQRPGVMPLYWQTSRPLPDALTDAMTICDSGFSILKELLASSTSDAEQLHDVNTAPVGQPPAEKATSAQHTRFTETDFFGAKGENAMRRTLAVMVGDVIGGTGITGPQQLPNVYAKLWRGGAFRDVMNSWVGELPPDMQDNVTRIAGIRAGDWSAYDKEPDSRENMMRMIWLCLAYLVGLPEAHDAEARTIARNVRRAGERYCEPRSSKPSPVRIVTGTTIGKWAQSYLNIGEK
ncbi:hypothetical protein DEO12_17015 [Escherichia coli]|uniref:hypothetical protein n=1 Tax=Escherichia coli TaxID=562 RepID=UPI001075A590|nr:hypothetical protein [Escherichia coli]TFX12184.1 hypothetical protein DEO12_17015 [Escherichia coli]